MTDLVAVELTEYVGVVLDNERTLIVASEVIGAGSSGGGGGAVDSVNAQTGVVVLDADDIDDTSTTNKFVTAADVTKLGNLSGTNTGDQDLSTYYHSGGTDVPVTDGGTGASTASGARTNLGLGSIATAASTAYPKRRDVDPGGGTNDDVALQAYLDTLESAGGGVMHLFGTYTVENTVYYPSNVIIVGEQGLTTIQGNGSTLGLATGIFAPKTAGSTSQTTFRNLKILESQGTVAGLGLDLTDASNMRTDSVRVEGFSVGVKLDDTTNTTFYGDHQSLTIFNCDICLDIAPSGTQPNQHTFTAGRFKPNSNNSSARGVRIGDARGITFLGCDIEASTATYAASLNGTGVELATTGSGSAREVTFVNCWIEGHNNAVTVASACKRIVFVGGTMAHDGSGAGYLTDNTSPTEVRMFGVNRDGQARDALVSGTRLGTVDGSGFVATFNSGTGSPESSVTADRGSLYLNHSGGTGTTLYIKETGNGTNTGWIAVAAGGSVSDTAYDATTWNGVTTVAPSKNAVRDQFEVIATSVSDHLADTTDAHDASAISVADAGAYYSGTDVETVTQEIGASLAAVDPSAFDAAGDGFFWALALG